MGELDFPVVARGRGVTDKAKLLSECPAYTWTRMQRPSGGHEGQTVRIYDALHSLSRAHVGVESEAMLAHNVFEQFRGQPAILLYAS